jgi:photosystem II stability/assembly factor-like uncharacterized protein
MALTPARMRAIVTTTAALALVVSTAPASSADVPHVRDSRSAPAAPSRGVDQLPFSWQILSTGSIGNLVAIDAVSADVAWATSSDTAEVLLTTDGGDTFNDVAPPEGVEEGLQFYDVEARSADEAIVLAAGTGDLSRIYRTTDGGDTWDETFRAVDSNAFFDCIAMFDKNRGLAMGDPVDGKFQVILTSDAGATWDYAPASGQPDILEGEAGWAASGNCVNATGRRAWFGTGAGPEGRVFRSDDYGMTWTAASTGLAAGPSGGIMGVDFRTNKLGIAVGGDFTGGQLALARSTDGGATWTPLSGSVPNGYRTGVAWWSDLKGDEIASDRTLITPAQKTVFAVGPSGSDFSADRGKTWEQFDSNVMNAVDCVKGQGFCWAAGGGGVVGTLAVG